MCTDRYVAQDMCDTDDAKRCVEETIKLLGGIDIIIANAVRTTQI